MDSTKELFRFPELYNHEDTDSIFVDAVKQNIMYQRSHCREYADILDAEGYKMSRLKAIGDICQIPPLPTVYLKANQLHSIPFDKMLFESTSSGTGGKMSHVGFDAKGLCCGVHMVWKTAVFHKLFSVKPTNYIMLGYKPSRENKTIISKTALGASFFAPGLGREYALVQKDKNYQSNLGAVIEALLRFEKQPFPIRLIGFPAFLLFLLKELERTGIRVKLHGDSMIFLGGGWKQFYTERVEKKELYHLAEKVLGIRERRILEFYGAAEHPVIYCACKNHHFHVPTYSRVIVRDVDTLCPLAKGQTGILNFITPMLKSIPLTSIMTDDLGILHDAGDCGCGIKTPYFEILGRAGLQGIKTCAAGAEKLLGGAAI